jgi:photosynthetic reaction center cytochrome c subunit
MYVVGGLVFSLALGAQTASPPKGKTAEQVYKNIQVLRGAAATEIIPSMQFMSSSLGVRCDHCHVEGAFDKDDKKPKQQAREMMRMVSTLNQNNFAGQRGITCYSCHAGNLRPRRTPVVDPGKPARPVASAPSSASAAAILDRYFQAIGGVPALRKISSEVEKGTMELSHGVQFPIEIAWKQPDLRSVRVQYPNGDSLEVENGDAGWSLVPGRPLHSMSASEAAAARTEANPAFLARLTQTFSKLEMRPETQIAGHPVSVIRASNPNQAPVKLYFDKQSGLLVRLLRYVDSPLGRNPTQMDYSDYRDVAGVRLPFRWTAAQPQGQFTVQLGEIQVNVPIDNSRFNKPTEEVAAAGN